MGLSVLPVVPGSVRRDESEKHEVKQNRGSVKASRSQSPSRLVQVGSLPVIKEAVSIVSPEKSTPLSKSGMSVQQQFGKRV